MDAWLPWSLAAVGLLLIAPPMAWAAGRRRGRSRGQQARTRPIAP